MQINGKERDSELNCAYLFTKIQLNLKKVK